MWQGKKGSVHIICIISYTLDAHIMCSSPPKSHVSGKSGKSGEWGPSTHSQFQYARYINAVDDVVIGRCTLIGVMLLSALQVWLY